MFQIYFFRTSISFDTQRIKRDAERKKNGKNNDQLHEISLVASIKLKM